ncbi:hypothetical protein [Taibaiella soli]|nr:hypothetical protein [Taibaiella soli]
MKYLITVIMLCIGLQAAQAQDVYTSSGRSMRQIQAKKKQENKGFDPSKIIAGGFLGLSFGTSTSVYVAPVIGYRITDKLAAGIDFSYTYYKYKDYFYLQNPITGESNYYDLSSDILSIGVWARYLVFSGLFVGAQFDQNYMSYTDPGFDPNGSGNIVNQKVKYDAPSLLLGAGYRAPIGDRASVNFSLMYDVLQNQYSPYYGRVVPMIGFMYGF